MIKHYLKSHSHLLWLTISAFSFYLISMPKTVALEDDGLFLLAAYFNGISHPPGYPLHSLLGYLFVHFPIGNPAANGHALSALFSAFSAVLVFLITEKLTFTNNTQKKLASYIAAVAYILADTVWSQSIITEVYTLNAFLFLVVLYLAIIIREKLNNNPTQVLTSLPQLKGSLFLLGLFSGLALANHWPLFILGSVGIIFLLIEYYKTFLQYWHLVLSGILIGLTPYVWLYINSNPDTFIQYYGPLENLGELYSYISREHFNHSVDFSPTATFVDKIKLAGFTLQELVTQWGKVNILFVPLGILTSFITYKKNKYILLSILISYLASSILLSMILGYDYDQDARINMPPFFVQAHALGAIFFSLGVTFVITKISSLSSRNFIPLLLFTILLQAFIANISINYRANYDWTDKYAKHVLDTLKPDSSLFVSGDIGTGVIGYWHFIKGYRPDITIIQDDGLVLYGTRLFNPKKNSEEEKKNILLSYIKNSEKPVYFLNHTFEPGVNDYWLVYEYNKDVPDKKQRSQSLSKENQKYLHYIFSDIQFTDNWTQQHLNGIRITAIPYLLNQLILATDDKSRATIKHYLLKATNKLPGIALLLKTVHELKEAHSLLPIQEIINKGWSAYEKSDLKIQQAFFLNTLADISYKNGYIKKSIELYKQSINVWKHNDNIAHKKLLTLEILL